MDELKRIIVTNENGDKVLNDDLYSYIKRESDMGRLFIVCHVTLEEFNYMSNIIKENKFLPEKFTSETGFLYNRFRYMMGYNNTNDVIELADYDKVSSDIKPGRYFIENDEMKFNIHDYPFNDIYSKTHNLVSFNCKKIYTTETFDDVKKHYNELKRKKNTDQLMERIAKRQVFVSEDYELTEDEVAEQIAKYNQLIESGIIEVVTHPTTHLVLEYKFFKDDEKN